MDVVAASAEGRTWSPVDAGTGKIELLSYSRRTLVMLQAPGQTVPDTCAMVKARLAAKDESSSR